MAKLDIKHQQEIPLPDKYLKLHGIAKFGATLLPDGPPGAYSAAVCAWMTIWWQDGTNGLLPVAPTWRIPMGLISV